MIVCRSLFRNNLKSQCRSSLNMRPKPTGLLTLTGDRRLCVQPGVWDGCRWRVGNGGQEEVPDAWRECELPGASISVSILSTVLSSESRIVLGTR